MINLLQDFSELCCPHRATPTPPTPVAAFATLDRVSRSGEIQQALTASSAIFYPPLVFWCSRRARNAPFWSCNRSRQMVTLCWCDPGSEDPSTLAKKNSSYNVHVPYVHERPRWLDLEKNKLERGHQGQYICWENCNRSAALSRMRKSFCLWVNEMVLRGAGRRRLYHRFCVVQLYFEFGLLLAWKMMS